MPVILGEASVLTTPLSLVRIWALVSGCLTFSLVASLGHPQLAGSEESLRQTLRAFCMFTWCFFFILTLIIILVEFIQFQSLLPISWKNLPITVAALGALMYLSTSVSFPWTVMTTNVEPKAIAATVSSCLTFLAYASETYLIRLQGREQRGYMASAPGLLKIFQVFGGCLMLVLVSKNYRSDDPQAWLFWLKLSIYVLCFLMSLGTVVVMLGDCASRCPLPFDRLLAGFSHLGVLLYMVVTVICFTNILTIQAKNDSSKLVIESVITCLTLLAYTVDLAFSIKLLCDRG
ncbi:myeloid-associated differentiation marker homolog [Megalops cyprinoides]|uniref:myeloid-associated differentiation marker homolog n=1 Tax=Megalops cyprinoides TaxID=118141 RepID=UPI001864AC44|nr:myeloid-associated differentiation marker homolog [Megalops cyprinoides]